MTAAVLPPSAAITGEQTLNQALSLISKGYHVFPVLVRVDPVTGANTKTYVTGRAESPIGAKWNATVSTELVRSWWGPGGRFVDCMIGIATEPSGVVLIDADTKHDIDGPGEWAALHPTPYPIPAAVGTSSTGGKHYPYGAQAKRPVRTCAGELAPALDTRGVGGMFVCWAPWLPSVGDLPVVPDVVPDRVPYVKRKAVTVTSTVDGSQVSDGTVQARVLEHATTVEEAADGRGIPTASRQAYFVGQYVGAGQVDLDWARAVMLAAIEQWTWRRPGDREKVQVQILKGIDDGAREPRAWLTEPELVDPAHLATVSVLRPRQAATPVAPAPTPTPVAPTPAAPPREPGEAAAVPAPVSPPAEPPAAATTSQVTVLDPGPARFTPDDDEADDGVVVHPGRRLVLTPLSEIRIKRARWLWEGRIPAGALSLIAGKQGLGKSTVVYDLVAQMTRGKLAGEFFGTPRSALICATEDDWSCTIKPRLVAAGADQSRVFQVDAVRADGVADGLVLPSDVRAVEDAARQVDAALMVLDPLTSRLDTALDGHKDGPVRQALEPLVAMAGRTGMALGGLMHLNKGAKSDPMDAVMGATAFTAVARSVLVVMRDPDDEERRRKFIGLAKANLGDIDLPTLVFRTVTALVPTDEEGDDRPAEVGRVEWLGQAEGSIADAMESASQDDETRTGIADAVRWLREHLGACGGEAEAMSIKDAARKAGFNERMVTRAKKRAGVVAATIPGTFPRRTSWMLGGKHPLRADSGPVWMDSSALSPADPSPTYTTDHNPSLQNSVSSVLSVSCSTDSADSGDGLDGVDTRSGVQSAHADSEGFATPAGPPCPCGRPEALHSRGNWRTDAAGHRWHAFGFGALDACPQCSSAAAGVSGRPGDAPGGDAG